MRTDGIWFKDQAGRALLLRGANLGGSTKVPARPNGATYIRDRFFDHRDVSFVGRPFPLDEADEHFRRLRAWGLTFLRLLVTWEAIEHAGPGQYDQEYLTYLRAIAEKAAEYGIACFIDPHQDVWSRWTGGDGAPGWTFDLIGMDITRLDATGAAFTHQLQGDPFPRMVWPSNHSRLGTATMFTLFFGGNDFATQLGRTKQASLELMGGVPTLMGEFGIPFDLDNKAAYLSGDFSTHIAALDAYINGMDAHLLNYTIWNYTSDNTKLKVMPQ
jgi:hypothetical protein